MNGSAVRQVKSGPLQELNRVTKPTDCMVAVNAEQPSHAPGHMVVVNVQIPVGAGLAADATAASLRSKDGVVPVRIDSVALATGPGANPHGSAGDADPRLQSGGGEFLRWLQLVAATAKPLRLHWLRSRWQFPQPRKLRLHLARFWLSALGLGPSLISTLVAAIGLAAHRDHRRPGPELLSTGGAGLLNGATRSAVPSKVHPSRGDIRSMEPYADHRTAHADLIRDGHGGQSFIHVQATEFVVRWASRIATPPSPTGWPLQVQVFGAYLNRGRRMVELVFQARGSQFREVRDQGLQLILGPASHPQGPPYLSHEVNSGLKYTTYWSHPWLS